MPILVKKMYHGNQPLLFRPVICTNGIPTEQEPLPPATLRGKPLASLDTLRIHLICLCYPGEQKTLKTAWEYYNEGTYSTPPSHIV